MHEMAACHSDSFCAEHQSTQHAIVLSHYRMQSSKFYFQHVLTRAGEH